MFAAKHQRRLGALSQVITPTWLLQRWGMDIVGPLPTTQGNFKFVVVAVEYFTSGLRQDLSPLSHQLPPESFSGSKSSADSVFIEKSVDNGKQFDCQEFREYCRVIGTKLRSASVYHPQSNGVVERTNGQIFLDIKKCLFDQKKGKWPNELSRVIWSHNTAESRATKFTSFRLLYGAEAVSG
jgi:hypothetical protein